MARKKRRTSPISPTGKTRIGISLNSKAAETLTAITKETGLSRSSLFESILEGSMAISSQQSQKTIEIPSLELEDENISQINIEVRAENLDSERAVREDFPELHQKLEEQKQLINNLEEQLTNQKNLLAQETKENQFLQKKIDEHIAKINSLEKEISEQKKLIISLI